jgi:hypothetical protein
MDEKGIALIVLSSSGDFGASAPFALTCAEDAQDRVRASQDTRPRDRGLQLGKINSGLGDGHTGDLKHDPFVRLAVEVDHIAIIMPRGARKAHLRSHYVGDTT